MKKIISISLACGLMILLGACGTDDNKETENIQTENFQTETEQDETSQSESEQVTEGGMQTESSDPVQPTQTETAPSNETAAESSSEADNTTTGTADAAEEPQEVIPSADWNGTFSKGDEQVTLAAADSTSFQFQFAVSGIAGVARVADSQNTATFSGDDSNIISFSISGSTLSISVSNPDVEGESASTISGVYELVQ